MSNAGAFLPPGGAPGIVDTLTGNTGGPVGPDGANNINVVGTGSVTIAGNPGTHTLTVSVSTLGFTWNVVTSTVPVNPIQAVPANAYITTGGPQVTFLLPLAPAIGDSFLIISATSTFRVNQNGGQSIIVGSASTASGAGGFLTSNTVGDTIEIVYLGTNTFIGLPYQGTVTTN